MAETPLPSLHVRSHFEICRNLAVSLTRSSLWSQCRCAFLGKDHDEFYPAALYCSSSKMCKWGKVWHLNSTQPRRCLLLGLLAFPRVLEDPAQEGPFMGEGDITNPSMTACLYPLLSLPKLKYSATSVAVLRLATGCSSQKDSPSPPRRPINDWAQLSRAAMVAFTAWTPLLLLAQLWLSHLRINFFCKGMWIAENTSFKVAIHLGILPLLLCEAVICVKPPCPGTSITCCPAMQPAPPMGALEMGSAWGDAGRGAPAGIRNVFACFNALH